VRTDAIFCPRGTDSSDRPTLFSIPTLFNVHQRVQTINICPAVIKQNQLYAHYKTPENRCELKNNFSVGPRNSGWALRLRWLTLYVITIFRP